MHLLKSRFLGSLLLIFSTHLAAQTPVKLSGTIQNASAIIQFSSPYFTDYLELTADGRFEVNFMADEFPIPVEFLSANAKGRILSISPTLWLVASEHTLDLNANKKTMSYTLSPMSSYQTLSEQLEIAKGAQFEQLLKLNPTSPPALYILNQRKREFSIKELKAIMEVLPASVYLNDYYQSVAAYLQAKQLKSPKKGDVFQSFSARNEAGKTITIAPKHNNYRLIALLSPSCQYSLKSIETLNGIKEHYAGKLEIVGIWSASSSNDLRPEYKEQLESVSWSNYWDNYGYANYYFSAEHISPTFLLVDPNGVVLQRVETLATDKLKAFKLP